MATRTATQSGLWSDTTTWGGAAIPVNGDAVVINTGVTVTFDVDQSGFANGLLSLQIDGKLTFKPDTNTCLKMNGNITGTGELWVGTEENPIQRPTAGSEYRCYLLFNSTGTINIPTIRMYGWYPDREYTQLSADASTGQNQIVLEEDLGLQQGDMIMVSSQTVTNFVESNKGIFAVTAYEPETKTVTLSPTIGDNRLEGDYVSLFSRPITLKRISGTTPFCNANFDASVIATGVKVYGCNLLGNSDYGTSLGEWNGCEFYHCSAEKSLIYPGKNCKFEDCNSGINSYGLGNGMYNTYTRCITTTGYMCYSGAGNRIEDCIQSNSVYISGRGMVTNSIFFNNKAVFYSGNSGEYVTNSIIHSSEVVIYLTISCPLDSKAINCVFKDNTVGYFRSGGVISLFNCLFEGKEIHDDACLYEHAFIESFDHNQIPGNYRAWCKGGTIETDFDGETVLPSRLIFNCESADYPVFRDFQVQLPQSRTMRWQALANKSFTGGIVKMELIDPTADPLIDSSAQPLVSYSLPDIADTNLPLKLGYKSTKSMQAIIRISAQNATGTVEIDTRLIENRVQHGR